MIRRFWCALFGHSPVIRVTQIQRKADAQPEDYLDPYLFNVHKFGATTVSMMCPCGRGAQQVLLGDPVASDRAQKEIDELRRMAKL